MHLALSRDMNFEQRDLTEQPEYMFKHLCCLWTFNISTTWIIVIVTKKWSLNTMILRNSPGHIILDRKSYVCCMISHTWLFSLIYIANFDAENLKCPWTNQDLHIFYMMYTSVMISSFLSLQISLSSNWHFHREANRPSDISKMAGHVLSKLRCAKSPMRPRSLS